MFELLLDLLLNNDPSVDASFFLGAGLLSLLVSLPLAAAPPGPLPWVPPLLHAALGLSAVGALAALCIPLGTSLARTALIAAVNVAACVASCGGLAVS